MVEIDEDELNATREQAAQAIPWRREAERLAEALYHLQPWHPLLRGELWQPMMEEKERAERGTNGTEPDLETMARISEVPHGAF